MYLEDDGHVPYDQPFSVNKKTGEVHVYSALEPHPNDDHFTKCEIPEQYRFPEEIITIEMAIEREKARRKKLAESNQ